MNPIDYIIILIVLLIIGAALFYIIRAKKKGQKCIGCPFSKTCSKNSCNKNLNNKWCRWLYEISWIRRDVFRNNFVTKK